MNISRKKKKIALSIIVVFLTVTALVSYQHLQEQNRIEMQESQMSESMKYEGEYFDEMFGDRKIIK